MKKCRWWCPWRRSPEQDEDGLAEAHAVLDQAMERAPTVAAIVRETRRQGTPDQFGDRFAAAFYSGRGCPT